MNIFFDIEESMSSEERDAFYQTKAGVALIQVKELIESRLYRLEGNFVWQDGAIILFIKDPAVFKIGFPNVKEGLMVEIKRSFRATDGGHIAHLIWQELHPEANPPTI